MNWFAAAAFSAISWGLISVIAKKLMDHDSSEAYTTLYTILSLIFYTPIFIYFISTSQLDYTSLAAGALIFSILGNITAFIAYNMAIKKGELSRVIPFTRLTPISTAIFAALILGEVITYKLGIGIVLATAGSIIVMKEKNVNYILSAEDRIKSRAIQLAIASSTVYGLTSVADRYATQIIAPEAYTFFLFAGMSTGFLFYTEKSPRHSLKEIKEDFFSDKLLYSITGLLAAAATYGIFYAFSKAPASQVVPVIQLQVLVSVIAGTVFFKEDDFLRKLVGSLILIGGVALVAI